MAFLEEPKPEPTLRHEQAHNTHPDGLHGILHAVFRVSACIFQSDGLVGSSPGCQGHIQVVSLN
jgi:hypothetical protein